MRNAFTIIEVIVTFVILSILIFFSIYTFRYSLINVQRATYYLPEKAAAFIKLDRAISGIFFYEIETEKQVFTEYFKGNSTSLEFITVAPPYDENLSIVHIFLKNNSFFMKYQPFYHKYTNLEHPSFNKNIPSTTIFLFKQIKNINISYVLRNKQTVSNITNQIPQGIIMEIQTPHQTIKLIFSILTNNLENRIRVYHDKYQL